MNKKCGLKDAYSTEHEGIQGFNTLCGKDLYKGSYDEYEFCPYCGGELLEVDE